MISGQVGRILSISNYPMTVGNWAWLSSISNLHYCDMSLSVELIDPMKTRKMLSSAVKETQSKVQSSSTGADSVLLQQELNLQLRLIQDLDSANEKMALATPLFKIMADDLDELKQRTDELKGIFASHNMTLELIYFSQEELFQHFLPTNNFNMSDLAGRPMPMLTVASSYPIIYDSLTDECDHEALKTVYIGTDFTGGHILLNLFKNITHNDGKRTNANGIIIGNTGSGKSTLAKKLMVTNHLQGTKVIVIDPEREYKDICHYLGGQWIDTGSSRGKVLNPLEVQMSSTDDDERLSIAQYLPTLRKFGMIAWELNEYESSLFESLCRKTYNAKGIDNKTDLTKLQPTDYPIFSDVLTTLEDAVLSNKDVQLSDDELRGYSRIKVYLSNLVEGAEGQMWNAHTTLEVTGEFIVLDIHSLLQADDRLRNAQLFLLLGFAWTQLAKDRQDVAKTKLLFVDEAHLLIDPKYPHALDFLHGTIKRARKYNAGIMTITQQIEDFFHEDIKRYGETLFEQSTYAFLGKQSEKGIASLTKVLGLSDTEQERLRFSSRGSFLLSMTNTKRIQFQMAISPYELDIFGSGGGR
ncbi:MAG: VirB4 family type IV secretion system protein [Culicoidibacterales bacterium]